MYRSASLVFLILTGSCLTSVSAGEAPEMSPNGRIDILDGQKQESEGSRDLIFKNSAPLKSIVAGQAESARIPTVCEAEFSTNYHQAGDHAIIDVDIDNGQCAASKGKYKVNVRTSDDNAEISQQVYKEQWQRADSQPMKIQLSYPIPEGSELVSARIKLPTKDYCTCTETQ